MILKRHVLFKSNIPAMEVTAYELRFDYKRREKTFFLALFCLLKQLQWQFK